MQYTRRTAAVAAPLSLRDSAQTAAPDDTVYLSIASANRDPEVFEAADSFDIGRVTGPRPHLALGVGAHFCLGAALARLELSSLFAAVAEIAPGMQLAGEPRPGQGNQFIHSLAGLPVTVRR